MKFSDAYVQPGYLLRRGHQISTAAFNSVVNGHDVTPVQMSSLICIRDNPGVDATRLSELIRFDRTTIGHVLGRLEKKKLIERREGTHDKRTKSLFITKRGIRLLDELCELTSRIADVMLDPLTEKERSDLMRILIKLDRNTTSEP